MGNAHATGVLTIPAEPFRYRLANVPDGVQVRGGGYFLLPSLSALRRLAAGQPGVRTRLGASAAHASVAT
jgi:hypothetical protein